MHKVELFVIQVIITTIMITLTINPLNTTVTTMITMKR